MRSYPVKEKMVVSAISEIIWYKQTDKQTHILLLFYKDYPGVYNKVLHI